MTKIPPILLSDPHGNFGLTNAWSFEVSKNGKLYDPKHGKLYDPKNGKLYDLKNGKLYDPKNGKLYDPKNGKLYDLKNGKLYDPKKWKTIWYPKMGIPPKMENYMVIKFEVRLNSIIIRI